MLFFRYFESGLCLFFALKGGLLPFPAYVPTETSLRPFLGKRSPPYCVFLRRSATMESISAARHHRRDGVSALRTGNSFSCSVFFSALPPQLETVSSVFFSPPPPQLEMVPAVRTVAEESVFRSPALFFSRPSPRGFSAPLSGKGFSQTPVKS